MTFQLDMRTKGNQTFLDTPGLSDTALRQQAAAAITEALQQGGIYRVVFVITLESGRVRPADVATIQTVLGAADRIQNNYAIIINKILPSKCEAVLQNLEKITASIFSNDVPATPFVHINPKIEDLEDRDDVLAEPTADLLAFLAEMPMIRIEKEEVRTIQADDFDARSQALETAIAEFVKDKERMQQQMEKDREEFQAQIAAMQAKNEAEGKDESWREILRTAAPIVGGLARECVRTFGRYSARR